MNVSLQNGINAYENLKGDALLQNLKNRAQTTQGAQSIKGAQAMRGGQNAQPTQNAQNTPSSLQTLQAKGDNEEDKKLREQTDNFEALFLQIMLKDAIKNENPLYPKQPGSDIYHSMYIENLASTLSGSFGYSELLFNYLRSLQK